MGNSRLELEARLFKLEQAYEDLFERNEVLERAILEPIEHKLVEAAELRLPHLPAQALHVRFGEFNAVVPLAAEHMTKEMAEELAEEYNSRMTNGSG